MATMHVCEVTVAADNSKVAVTRSVVARRRSGCGQPRRGLTERSVTDVLVLCSFEVSSTEVTALMSSMDERSAAETSPCTVHDAIRRSAVPHSNRRWNLISSPDTSLKCRCCMWTVQSDWGDVSLGGGTTLRPPTTRRYKVLGPLSGSGYCRRITTEWRTV